MPDATASPSPTPHPEVNAVLGALLDGMRGVLGERLVGLYLYGSLSLGDFDPASSDVDFLAVTEGEVPEGMLDSLRAMHAHIAASGLPFADHLEGSYIPRAAWRRYDPDNATHPSIGVDWPFGLGYHERNWVIERYIVREHGVVVFGPPSQTLIDPISSEELRSAVCGRVLSAWEERIEDVAWLAPRNYQAFAVVTLCRALYTLNTGGVCSKPRAVAWAMRTHPAWQPLLTRALSWQSQHERDDVTETQAFLRAALAEANARCGERHGA